MSDKKSESEYNFETYDPPPSYYLSDAKVATTSSSSSFLDRKDSRHYRKPSQSLNAKVATTSSGSSFLNRSASKLGKMFSRNSGNKEALEAMEQILKPILEKYDIVFVIDDSGSMKSSDDLFGSMARGSNRWTEAREALMPIADIANRCDDDGVDIHFLNYPAVGRGLKSAAEVMRLFNEVEPFGGTPLGETLKKITDRYLQRLEQAAEPSKATTQELAKIKPVNYIVITDGEPNDLLPDHEIKKVLVEIANRLGLLQFPRNQLGIQFVQIGDDERATRLLTSLDDSLKDGNGQAAVIDIVDTTKYQKGKKLDTEVLIKSLVGSVNRRVDNEGARMFRGDI
ncbi:hypothetical protein D9758_004159 [Tetrapyrgos nigripes]|uniref:VWFA domain-containing protein n=1 Tax=Tetrapyrgos nigripes TaxID=182062 RepID=A0A8H5GU11_9AGAR|nr:hypothetical protein D9758_004159 [Tetrapyrgos nigripes]